LPSRNNLLTTIKSLKCLPLSIWVNFPKNPKKPKPKENWRQQLKELEAAFLKEVGEELIQSPKVKTLPEGDSGDVKTAGEFLNWAIEQYPSRRIALIGWSHGEGFDASPDAKIGNQSGKQGGFAFDYHSKNHMRVTDMAKGTRILLKRLRSTPDENRRFATIDLLGSDACLNQQVEFAYEWRGVADYVFGSSTIVQSKGFNYRTFLKEFVDRPRFSNAHFGKRIPMIYKGSVTEGSGHKYGSYYDPNGTMATWTMSEMIKLHRAMDDLGKELLVWINLAPDEIDRIDRQAEIRDLIRHSIRKGGISTDLTNFLQILEGWARENNHVKIRKEVQSTRRVLSLSVLSYFVGKNYRKGLTVVSKGVAVWLPVHPQEYFQMFPKFKSSRFYKDLDDPTKLSGWAKFVENLY